MFIWLTIHPSSTASWHSNLASHNAPKASSINMFGPSSSSSSSSSCPPSGLPCTWWATFLPTSAVTALAAFLLVCLRHELLWSQQHIIVWWVQEIKVKRSTQHNEHNTFLPLPPKEQYQHEIGCVTATPFRPNFPLRDNLRDRNYSIAQIIAQGKVRPQLVCLNFCLMRDRATSL